MKRQWLNRLMVPVIFAVTAQAAIAGSFANLNFEDSTVSSNAPGPFTTADLFPSWTVRFDNTVQTAGSLNGFALTGTADALMISDVAPAHVLEGTRSLYLQSGVLNSAASIGQVGDVPAGTQTLRFLSRNPIFPTVQALPGLFELKMNGQDVPLVALSVPGQDMSYGADISAWAGTTADLRIVMREYLVSYPTYSGGADVDSISFSSSPLPEPSGCLLAMLGTIILRRRRRNTSNA